MKKGKNKKEQPEIAVTLKGAAALAAIDAGLVPKSSDGEGWDIAPFLRFWGKFEPTLIKTLESCGAREIY
nr:MAG TPA: hypothetical protein [Caudoviricetes sp.]